MTHPVIETRRKLQELLSMALEDDFSVDVTNYKPADFGMDYVVVLGDIETDIERTRMSPGRVAAYDEYFRMTAVMTPTGEEGYDREEAADTLLSIYEVALNLSASDYTLGGVTHLTRCQPENFTLTYDEEDNVLVGTITYLLQYNRRPRRS